MVDFYFFTLFVLHICTIQFMHKFNMGFVFHFYILGCSIPVTNRAWELKPVTNKAINGAAKEILMSWIWTNLSTEGLKFESPSKRNSHEGFNLEHWLRPLHIWAKSCDREIVKAQKKVFKGRPKTPSNSCSVVTDPRVQCEVICDRVLNQMLFRCKYMSLRCVHFDPRRTIFHLNILVWLRKRAT